MNDEAEFGVVHIVAMNVPAFAFGIAHDVSRSAGRRERQCARGQKSRRSELDVFLHLVSPVWNRPQESGR